MNILNPYEKKLRLLELVQEQSVIKNSTTNLLINANKAIIKGNLPLLFTPDDFIIYLRELKTENIIRVSSSVLEEEGGSLAFVDILPDFGTELIKVKKQYLNYEKQSINLLDENCEIYRISYKNYRISINNFVLSHPNFNNENEIIFSYLYEHPNKRVTKQELEEKALNGKLKKSLNLIVQGLGFNGKIREVFFNVSEKGIIFNNPVYRKDIIELGTPYIDINTIISSKK